MSDNPVLPIASPPPAGQADATALSPAAVFLAIASGCAAMLNILAWWQNVQLSRANSPSGPFFAALVLGGLCLGSFFSQQLVTMRRHPLRVLAVLHLAMAVASIDTGLLFVKLFLLPAGLLMGATLPVIARWAASTARASLGMLYSLYLAGAVAACLLAGFILLPNYDVFASLWVAGGINVIVGFIALLLARRPHQPVAPARVDAGLVPSARPVSNFTNTLIYITIGLSGLVTCGALSVWTRLLAMILGPTAFSYSIIATVFLAGLVLGSAVGTMFARSAKSPRAALAWCQALSCLAIGWAAWALTNGITNWPIDPIYILEGRTGFALDFARTAWAILPATLCWGASFPLALAAVTGTDSAKPIARVFAAQTLGGVLGTLFFGIIAVASWGTEGSEHILIGIAGFAAVIAALSLLADAVLSGKPDIGVFIGATSVLLAALCIAAVTVGILMHGGEDRIPYDRIPWQLVAYGREIVPLRKEFHNRSLQDLREGQASSIAIVSDRVTDRFLHVDGMQLSSNATEDLQLQYMLGHFPALFHPAPKKVLVLGCGTGIVAGSFAVDLPARDPKNPDDVKIVICEPEPILPGMVGSAFRDENYSALVRNPTTGKFIDDRVELATDDPRHYLETTTETFDIIAGSLTPPWVQGAANLQTREYFDLAKKHLKPGGMVSQWVPLYGTSPDVVKCQFKTFFDAFPAATAWWNDRGMHDGIRQYDIVLIGGDAPLKIDAGALKKRMGPVLTRAFAAVQLDSPVAVLRSYAGQASDLSPWFARGTINRDANLRLQYVAGRTLNESHAVELLDTILSARTFPAEFMNLTDDQRADLEQSWATTSPHIVPESRTPPETPPQ